jgi:hypothetical protein
MKRGRRRRRRRRRRKGISASRRTGSSFLYKCGM